MCQHGVERAGAFVGTRQHHSVTRVLARQHGANPQAGRLFGRHVLAAVHGDIDRAADERVFDLLHEEALATHLRERGVRQAIAGCRDDDDLAGDA